MLKCSRCKEVKPESSYYRNPLRPSRGFNYDCNACRATSRRAKRLANHEEIKALERAYRASNPERARDATRRWRLRNPEKHAARRKELRNRDIAEYNRQARAYAKTRAAQRREYERRRRKTDVNYHIQSKLRGRIRGAVQMQGTSRSARTEELLGCSIAHFKWYLANRFQSGMSWLNRQSWHVDHKIPCAKFDLRDPEQQRACFHFSNLQPLWPVQNHAKGARFSSV